MCLRIGPSSPSLKVTWRQKSTDGYTKLRLFGIGSDRSGSSLSPSLKSILQSPLPALCVPARQRQRLNKKALAVSLGVGRSLGRASGQGRGREVEVRARVMKLHREERGKRTYRADGRASGGERKARGARFGGNALVERRCGGGGGYSFRSVRCRGQPHVEVEQRVRVTTTLATTTKRKRATRRRRSRRTKKSVALSPIS